MLVNGDKLVVKNKVANFLDEGDIIKIVDVRDNGIISFAFGEAFEHMGLMSSDECEKHFEKFVEKKEAPKITEKMIDDILADSEFDVKTIFDKCTVVTCKLPNGFVITESSACVSPENYDEEMGFEICIGKITDKLWELEGYRLQDELYRNGNAKDVDCEECYCDECPCEECDECEYDDYLCLYTDLDCDDCEDYTCINNPKHYS